MADDFSRLPGVLAEIAEAAGRPAALAIADAYGGCRLYVPSHADDDHAVVQLVGRKAADALCAYFATARGGGHLDIPLGAKSFYRRAKKRALEMSQQGVSTSAIVKALGISRTTVMVARRRGREADGAAKDDRQKDFS